MICANCASIQDLQKENFIQIKKGETCDSCGFQRESLLIILDEMRRIKKKLRMKGAW